MSFSSSAGGNGILGKKRPMKNRSLRIPERIRRLRIRSKDMLCVEKCRCRLTPKLTATCTGMAM